MFQVLNIHYLQTRGNFTNIITVHFQKELRQVPGLLLRVKKNRGESKGKVAINIYVNFFFQFKLHISQVMSLIKLKSSKLCEQFFNIKFICETTILTIGYCNYLYKCSFFFIKPVTVQKMFLSPCRCHSAVAFQEQICSHVHLTCNDLI